MQADRKMDSSRFRDVMSRFATGVCVVTSRGREGLVGLTVNAFTSVSLEPPLILVCISSDSPTSREIVDSGAFAVNVLGASDEAVARRFASGEREGRFAGVEHRAAATGSPILPGALAWVDCRVWAVHEAGDHAILVGRVEAAGGEDGSALVFFRGRFGSVE